MESIKKQIGQMFIVRMLGKTITEELETLIKDYSIGGICLYSKNYNSYKEMLTLINNLKELNKKYNKTPLFIAIDQEGGRVNRLPKDINNIVSAKKLSKNNEYIKEAGNIFGEILSKSGINMNFSPVLDIQRFEDKHAIGDRCFGNNANDVSNKGLLMMKYLKKNNIISVVKHFPGHGLVKNDTHFLLPLVSKDIDNTEDIIPFKEAIKQNTDAMMLSHIIFSKIDLFNPASLSKKVIKGYLQNNLHYEGLIITDDLKMKPVNLLYGFKKSSLKAINAGNNLILIGAKHNIVINCINYINNKLNKELETNINNSYGKILSIKDKYNITDELNKPIDIEKYNERINKLNNKCTK